MVWGVFGWWEVGGRGGGEMVLGSGGGGKDGFCGGWFCILFSFGFLSVYI
jgi:hypothetical protein